MEIRKDLVNFIATELDKFSYAGEYEGYPKILPNLDIDIYEELSRDAKNDVNIFVIQLPAVPQANVTQFPFQILIQVKEKYSMKLFDCFCEIVNKWLLNTFSSVNGQRYMFNANYPSMPEKMVEMGFENFNMISLDVNILPYNNIYGIKEIDLANNKLNFVNVSINYSTTTSSSGQLENGRVKTAVETGLSTYMVTFIPENTTDSLIDNILNNTLINQASVNYVYALRIDNSEINVRITGATFEAAAGLIPTLSLTMMRSD